MIVATEGMVNAVIFVTDSVEEWIKKWKFHSGLLSSIISLWDCKIYSVSLFETVFGECKYGICM